MVLQLPTSADLAVASSILLETMLSTLLVSLKYRMGNTFLMCALLTFGLSLPAVSKASVYV